MRGSRSVLVALVVLAAAPAFGQYADIITACRWDSKQLCAGALPEAGALAACIKANFAALGRRCEAALVRIAAVRESCAADIAAQCPAIKPGAGRLLFCVKMHYAALSEPCRDAIGRAADRRLQAH